MEENYKKIIDDRIKDWTEKGKKFVLIQNTINGKERVFLLTDENYRKLTNKQKKFLMED